VQRRGKETGLLSFVHNLPFILTQNWRLRLNSTRASWILRFLFCCKSLMEICKLVFVNAWYQEDCNSHPCTTLCTGSRILTS